MNRFKFRIWDGQKFRDPNSCHLSLEGKNTIFSYENGGLNIIQQSVRETIHQSTGSLDKHNKEIYECDIVLFDGEDPFDSTPCQTKKVVGWNQRVMQFRLYSHPNEIGEKGGEPFFGENVEVIGHVYDFENESCKYLTIK